MALKVEVYGKHIGNINPVGGGIEFVPVPAKGVTSGSTLLSLSLPMMSSSLNSLAFNRSRAEENFFTGLLPEGVNLESIARQKGVATNDLYGMLKAVGRDVAGALVIYDPQDPYNPPQPYTSPLTDSAVKKLLHPEISGQPLGNDMESGMISLGGYQNKIMLTHENGQWHQAHYGYPTTHIIKPVSTDSRYADMIYSESFGLDIARAAGVVNYDSKVHSFLGEDALVIERFDRYRDKNGVLQRLHQENAVQALGESPRHKYESYGAGAVSLAKIADLLRLHGSLSDVEELLRVTTVNAALGNLDAHGINFGIMHYPDESIRIAPAYDLVPTSHYGSGGELALHVGGKKLHRELTVEDIINEGVSWKLKRRRAEPLVQETLDKIKNGLENLTFHQHVPQEVVSNVTGYSKNLLDGKEAGVAVLLAKPVAALPAPQQKTMNNGWMQGIRGLVGAKCGHPVKRAGGAPCVLRANHRGSHRSRC